MDCPLSLNDSALQQTGCTGCIVYSNIYARSEIGGYPPISIYKKVTQQVCTLYTFAASITLRLAQPVEDTADHSRGERALAGGVAQLLEFAGKVTVEGDPAFQFSPGSIGCQSRTVSLGQFRAAVFLTCIIHTAKILIFSDLCKFLWKEIHVIHILSTQWKQCFQWVEALLLMGGNNASNGWKAESFGLNDRNGL